MTLVALDTIIVLAYLFTDSQTDSRSASGHCMLSAAVGKLSDPWSDRNREVDSGRLPTSPSYTVNHAQCLCHHPWLLGLRYGCRCDAVSWVERRRLFPRPHRRVEDLNAERVVQSLHSPLFVVRRLSFRHRGGRQLRRFPVPGTHRSDVRGHAGRLRPGLPPLAWTPVTPLSSVQRISQRTPAVSGSV